MILMRVRIHEEANDIGVISIFDVAPYESGLVCRRIKTALIQLNFPTLFVKGRCGWNLSELELDRVAPVRE